MIRPGFLSADERSELRALARDGSSEARAARRANAIVLLDSGWSCAEVAGALSIDGDTVRSRHGLYAAHGLTGLVVMGHQGSKSHLSREAEAALVAWVGSILPRNTRSIGAGIAKEHGVAYSHAGLLALLHRLKLVYRKPDLVSANPRIKSGGGPALAKKPSSRITNGCSPGSAATRRWCSPMRSTPPTRLAPWAAGRRRRRRSPSPRPAAAAG